MMMCCDPIGGVHVPVKFVAVERVHGLEDPLHHVYSLHVLALHEPHTAAHHTHGHVVIFRFRSGHHLQDRARSLVESLHRGQNITV
jgi:hypothetical protein